MEWKMEVAKLWFQNGKTMGKVTRIT
jgi:hypothetical protein